MKTKISHLLGLKSTWVIMISQVFLILQILGVFDTTVIEKWKEICVIILEIATTLGIVIVYNTEPKKTGL